MNTEKVFAWRLIGGPTGSMGDSGDHFNLVVVTKSDKILVKDFAALLGEAFTNQGRPSFVGSRVSNKLVKAILAPKIEGEHRKVGTFRINMYTGFHSWNWELLGDATLEL